MKIKFSADRNTLKIVLVVLVVLCTVCAISLIKYISKTSTFEKVQAKIVNIETIYDRGTKNNQNKNKYVSYSFVYNGKEYTAQKLIVLPILYKIGDKTMIKINPLNPREIENTLYTVIYIFTITISLFLIFAIIMHIFKIDKTP